LPGVQWVWLGEAHGGEAMTMRAIEALVAAVLAAERERCAKSATACRARRRGRGWCETAWSANPAPLPCVSRELWRYAARAASDEPDWTPTRADRERWRRELLASKCGTHRCSNCWEHRTRSVIALEKRK
jgi:hypothetical protein